MPLRRRECYARRINALTIQNLNFTELISLIKNYEHRTLKENKDKMSDVELNNTKLFSPSILPHLNEIRIVSITLWRQCWRKSRLMMMRSFIVFIIFCQFSYFYIFWHSHERVKMHLLLTLLVRWRASEWLYLHFNSIICIRK